MASWFELTDEEKMRAVSAMALRPWPLRDVQDEEGAALGDPRRCPAHGEPTSSPDGLFDAPCSRCEMEQEADHEERVAELRERGRLG